MITYVVGDLFQSPAKVLVNPVNTVGVMGAGIAADFKSCYPEMFAQYQALCDQKQLEPGRLWLYRTPHKWILNFPTKEHWRSPATVDGIVAGLQKFAATYAEQGITSVSFPLIGTGHGRLDWEADVRPLMEAYLGPLPIAVYIHRIDVDDPFKTQRISARSLRAWLNGLPQKVPFIRFWRDLARLGKKQTHFKTVDGSAEFRAMIDDGPRRSVALYPKGRESLFLPETMLADLWVYLQNAGYASAHNLAGGLDEHAPYLFGLLAELDYLRPALLSWDDKTRHTGLRFIPPVDRQAESSAQRIVLR